MFEDIVHNGKVYYIGSSNFGVRHLCYAQAAAKERHFLALVAEQCQYTLLHRLPEIELIPDARGLGIGIMPWCPLAGGMLSGNYKKGERRGNRRYMRRSFSSPMTPARSWMKSSPAMRSDWKPTHGEFPTTSVMDDISLFRYASKL